MTTTLAARAENTLLTLNRIVSLLRGRQVDVVAITFARTEVPGVALLTIVVNVERIPPERLIACLDKLDDVWDVVVVAGAAQSTLRELAMVEVRETHDVASTLDRLESGLVRVIRRTRSTAVVELVGRAEEIDAAIDLLRPLDVVSMTRVGPIAALAV